MKFVKMQGCGNDYVYVDGVTDPAVAARVERADWGETVRRMSDRHTGVGSDGVIVVGAPTEAGRSAGAAVRMRMFNADGSEAEMCGNGVRCVVKFAHDRLGRRASPMLVETGRGVLSITYETVEGRVVGATVDMGEPVLELERVPVDAAQVERVSGDSFRLRGDERAWRFVSMGNPHAVAWAGALSALDEVRSVGARLERHAAFPARANIHFARAVGRERAEVVTWERGAGVTQACGTGACAVVVAGVLEGVLAREVTVRVLGGELRVRWDEATNRVFMTGPAEDVFEGDWREGEGAGAGQPVLRTERLVLRPFVMGDAAEVARCGNDMRIAGVTLTMPHPYTRTDAEMWIGKHAAGWAAGTQATYAICERRGDGGERPVIGATGLHRIEKAHGTAELGYWVSAEKWGRGYATEAAREIARFAFETLGMRRVHASHFKENPSSGRVMEKMGMRREGEAPGHVVRFGVPRDLVMYGMMAEEWRAVCGRS